MKEEQVATPGEAERAPGVSGRSDGGLALLRTRDFGLLWSGQVISQIGDGLSKVALLWFVYAITGSALKMTVVGLLQTIPPFVFGPLIGVYLDRLSKKAVMIWVDLLRTLMVLLIPVLYALDVLTLGRLYLLVFLISVFSTIFGPALASAVPLIVNRPQLTAANALLQGSSNVGMLVGPAVGGLGIALVGAQNVLYLDAATFFISACCLMPIRVRENGKGLLTLIPAAEGPRVSGTVLQDLLAGFRFVFHEHRIIFHLMVSAAFFNLGVSAFTILLPVYAKEFLQVGPVKLGWIWSGLGVGMLVASALLAWANQGDLRHRLKMMARAMTVGGLAVCGLSQLHTPLFAAALVIVVGGSTAVFTPVVWSLLQEMTPGHLLGRVFTTFSTGGMASAMIGMTGFGWAADAIGPATSLVGIGLVLVSTAAVLVYFNRRRPEMTLQPSTA